MWRKSALVLFTLWGGLHFIFCCTAVRKGKGNLLNKDWNGGMLCGIIESGTIKYR